MRVSATDADESYFVAGNVLARGRYLDGDHVEATLTTRRGRVSVESISVLRRSRRLIFGVVNANKTLRVDPWVSLSAWPIGDLGGAQAGDAAMCIVQSGHVAVHATFGPSDSVEALVERAKCRSGLSDVLYEVARLGSGDETESRGEDRRRVEEVVFTIDGPTSRDLDDALSCRTLSNGNVVLSVHIADVASKVPLGSSRDRRARKLGSSTYLPGQVLPMFDEALSYDTCSLLAGVERDCLSVDLEIDHSGEVLSSEIYPSRIRSNAQLTYRQVAAYLEGGVSLGERDLEAAVSKTHEVTTWLKGRRALRGRDTTTRDGVLLGVVGGVVEVVEDDASEVAHDLIEEAMICANEAVARFLVEHGVAAVFRTHDAPGSDARAALEYVCAAYGLDPLDGDVLSLKVIEGIEHQLRIRGEAPRVVRDVLRGRTLRATYESCVGGHYGLASDAYVHFTSPIRRYADLSVHRVVRSLLSGNDGQSADDFDRLCAELNEATSRCARAERYANALLWAKWLGEHYETGSVLGGHIVRLGTKGALVRLDVADVSGWVAPGAASSYSVDEYGLVLSAETTTWRLGERLSVTLGRIDGETGDVELSV